MTQRLGEGGLGEVRTPELDEARATLLGEADVIEPEPAAVLDLTVQLTYLFCQVEGSLA